MDKYYLENPSKMKDALLDDLFDNPEQALGMNVPGSHADIHMVQGQDLKSMFKEIIENNKSGSGSFVGDRDDALEFITAAAMQELDRIVEWVVKEKFLFKNKEDYNRIAFSVPYKIPGPTGIILKEHSDGTFHEMESKSIRLVLTRDKECEYGFTLTTAYPPMDEYSLETGRVFTREDVILDDMYAFDSRLEEAAFILKGEKEIYSEYNHDLNSYEPCIRLIDRPAIAYIHENSISYYKEANGGRRKSTREEIEQISPKMIKAIDKALSIIDQQHTIDQKEDRYTSFNDLMAEAAKLPDLPVQDSAVLEETLVR